MPRQVKYRASEWSWTGGVNYDITSQIGVFARYSRGNSFPQFDNLREGLTIIAKVDTYEGGLKVSMGWLNLYATLFHNKFDGLATTQIINNAADQFGGRGQGDRRRARRRSPAVPGFQRDGGRHLSRRDLSRISSPATARSTTPAIASSASRNGHGASRLRTRSISPA